MMLPASLWPRIRLSGGHGSPDGRRGRELAPFLAYSMDDQARGLRHFLPRAVQVPERLGHHDPSVLGELVEHTLSGYWSRSVAMSVLWNSDRDLPSLE